MLKRVLQSFVSVLLIAVVTAVPTPVLGADDRRTRPADVGPDWIPLAPPQDHWREMVARAEPTTYRPRGVPENVPWVTEDEMGAPPFFVSPTEPVRRVPSSSAATADAPSYQAGRVDYTRTEIADPTQAPFIQHGKLFIDFPGRTNVCSGTIVTSVSEDLVLTAGHCLEDPITGDASTGAVFIPGYRMGAAPAGVWVAGGYAVTEQWHASLSRRGDPRFDLGVLRFAPGQDGSGLSLQDRFGSRGAMFNLTFQQQFDSFGYPAAPGSPQQSFDGERLYTCASAIGFQDRRFPEAPFPTGMGCDMTPGSSGGGWIIEDQFINSVVSYSLDHIREIQFGPYFGRTAQAFYEEFAGIDHPDPGPAVDHEMRVTLSLRRHLIAGGVLRSVDGFAPCAAGTPIGVFKAASGSFKLVKQTRTSPTGAWKVRLRDRTGRYVAGAPEGPLDERDHCLEAISTAVRHRH
jgi:V8-like Glu-specific endopeptidase